MEKYHTIHENKNDLEQFYSAQREYNSQNFEYKEEEYVNKIVYSLQRYSPFNSSELVEDIDGKYVLLSDVLNLFSAKNKL